MTDSGEKTTHPLSAAVTLGGNADLKLTGEAKGPQTFLVVSAICITLIVMTAFGVVAFRPQLGWIVAAAAALGAVWILGIVWLSRVAHRDRAGLSVTPEALRLSGDGALFESAETVGMVKLLAEHISRPVAPPPPAARIEGERVILLGPEDAAKEAEAIRRAMDDRIAAFRDELARHLEGPGQLITIGPKKSE